MFDFNSTNLSDKFTQLFFNSVSFIYIVPNINKHYLKANTQEHLRPWNIIKLTSTTLEST